MFRLHWEEDFDVGWQQNGMQVTKEPKQTYRITCNKMWNFRCRKVSSSILATVPSSRLLSLKTPYEAFSNKTSHNGCGKEIRYFR